MKVSVQETEFEYKLIKEKPYKELLNKDTLISAAFLFFILILVKLYLLIPIIIFFAALATLQTIEDNHELIIKKITKEIIINRYYMGKWKVKDLHFITSDYSSVQIEKQVTTMREDGRFSINLLTEPSDSEIKGTTLVLLKNIDLVELKYRANY